MLYKTSLTAIARLARISLASILRTPFFWAWNVGLVLLALGLNHITYFDFESGTMASDLFLTTLHLSAGVNLLMVALATCSELLNRHWDILLCRPMGPAHIIVGRWVGAVIFQVAVSAVLTSAFLFDTFALGRTIPPWFWRSLYVSLLQVCMLAAFFILVATAFREFWAFCLMVGGFLVGHLSETILTWIPASLQPLGSVLFCVVPDLEIAPRGELDSYAEPLELFWKTAYSTGYQALALLMATMAVRRKYR